MRRGTASGTSTVRSGLQTIVPPGEKVLKRFQGTVDEVIQ
jgi:hypothetical protein